VKVGLVTLLRIVLSLTALFGAYYLIPARDHQEGSDLPWLGLALLAFGLVVALQVRVITRSRYPFLRAVETLALVVPVFLLIFARTYLSSSQSDPGSFTEVLDKTGALYFTVTCFATVGFGDIVASSDPMRVLVTVQMLMDLVVLGVVVRLFIMAAQRGIADRAQDPGGG
jgi:hypothetical protein